MTVVGSKLSQEAQVSWLLVVCWCLSIAQYGYRYIFQVNDTRTSNTAFYSSTPWYFSIVKFEILGAVLIYGCYRLLVMRRVPRFRSEIGLSWVALMVSLLVFALRMGADSTSVVELLQDYCHLWPFFLLTAMLPLLVRREQVEPTLRKFSHYGFWLCFPFWILTVYLYFENNRYPALSWPGHLRFGGILDDPNAYGILMSLLMVLGFEFKGSLWRFRVAAATLMLVTTQSFSSYLLLIFVVSYYTIRLLRPTLKTGAARPAIAAFGMLLVLSGIFVAAQFSSARLETELDSLWRFKQTSVLVHLDHLRFPDEMADASLFKWLFGGIGQSENAFNYILLNFGLVGLLAYTTVLGAFLGLAFKTRTGWGRALAFWVAATVADSVAIPFLAVFPINLLIWTILSCIILHNRKKAQWALQEIPEAVLQAA